MPLPFRRPNPRSPSPLRPWSQSLSRRRKYSEHAGGVRLIIRVITPAAVPAVEPVPVPEPHAAQDVPAATASEATAASAEKHDEHVSQRQTPPTPTDLQPKGLKAGRRLSSRLISGLKNFGKKDHVAKEDKREPTEPKHEESTPTTVVSDEAPRLGQPMLAEPIRIEEVSRYWLSELFPFSPSAIYRDETRCSSRGPRRFCYCLDCHDIPSSALCIIRFS